MVAGLYADKHKVNLLTADVLLGHHPADTLMFLPDLQLTVHLAPHTHVAPSHFAAVVAAGSLQEEQGLIPLKLDWDSLNIAVFLFTGICSF